MIRVSSFGKTESDLRDLYVKRILRMIPFSWTEISLKRCPDKRPSQLLPEEKKFLESHADLVLLDVGGKELNSQEFAHFCFKADRHFVIGPAVGFHDDFRKRASHRLSLSRLTFTHGLAQAILAESIYRAACELKNHPFVK